MLISESYREQNRKLHEMPHYGTSGQRYIKHVWQLIEKYDSIDILDYGCGKRTLETALDFPIANYDPAIAEVSDKPEPHDLVVCTDVLEHLEPECVDDVLSDIRRLTLKACFLVVSTRPAQKTLPDGRNAHLIQQPFAWWKERFDKAGLKVVASHEGIKEFYVGCE